MKITTATFQSVKKSDAPKSGWCQLSASSFARALRRTIPFASKDDSRPHVNAVHIECDGPIWRLVATDCHRIAVARVEGPTAKHTLLLPRSDAKILAAILSDPTLDTFEMNVAPPSLFIRVRSDVFEMRLGDGEFPPWRMVVPARIGVSAVVNRAAWLSLLKVAALTRDPADDLFGTAGLGAKYEIDASGLALSTRSFEARCDVVECSAPLVFGASVRLVTTALRMLGGDTVRLGQMVAGELEVIMLTAPTDTLGQEPYLAVVMPMRIS